MPEEQSPAGSHRLLSLAEKMHEKDYRDGYVAAHTRQVLAKQMREFRGDKSQTEFADLLDKRQTMVSRLENPNYSGWTVSTILEVASKLDVAAFVRFANFPTFLKYSGDLSESALRPQSYNREQVDDFARAEVAEEILKEQGMVQYSIYNPDINFRGFYDLARFPNLLTMTQLSNVAWSTAVAPNEQSEVAGLRRDLAETKKENAKLRADVERQAAEIRYLRETFGGHKEATPGIDFPQFGTGVQSRRLGYAPY